VENQEQVPEATNTWSRRKFLQMGVATGGAALALPKIARLHGAPRISQGSSAKSGGIIRYLAAAEGDSVYIQQVIAPQFTKQTGIKVQIDQVEYNNLYTKEILEFKTNTYDVYQVDQIWVEAYAKSGYLLALDKDIPKSTLANFYPNLVDICRVNGKLWSVPFSAIPVNYSYRKDILASHGFKPADTWQEALTIAQETNKSGLWGYPIRGQTGNPITWTWLPMLWSFGGQTFNSKMEPVYNSDTAIESVDFFKKLYKYSPPGWLSDAEVATTMEQGQAVQTHLQMVFDSAFENPKDSKEVGKIGFAGMPKMATRASILGMWTLGIGANSTKTANALKFIEYLSSPAIARQMAIAGVTGAPQPAIYKTAHAPDFFPVLGEVLGYVKPPPLIPEGNQWFIITGTALQNALSGRQTAKQAMNQAASQVHALLASAGYYK